MSQKAGPTVMGLSTEFRQNSEGDAGLAPRAVWLETSGDPGPAPTCLNPTRGEP